MEQLFPGIWKTPDESLDSFFISTCAYFIQTGEANILISSYSGIEEYFPFLKEQGGVDIHLLIHRHEAIETSQLIKDTFACKTMMHEEEVALIPSLDLVDELMKDDVRITKDCYLFHIPGHSPGGVALLWKQRDQHFLFTGDALYNSRGHWHMDITHGDREAAEQSIHKLKSLKVDVLLSSLSVGEQKIEKVTPEKWQWLLNDCLNRLQHGYHH